MGRVILKKGREKSLLRKHPWIFSGAVASPEGIEKNGETVEIFSSHGQKLAIGSWSAKSQIRVRVWTFHPEEKMGENLLGGLLARAIRLREQLISRDFTNAVRLVNAESDGLPGLIVDQYDRFLVCQFLSAGAEYWRSEIVRLLKDLVQPDGIYERSDAEVREKEGLSLRKGVLSGKTPPDNIEIREGGLRFLVNVRDGHKTGFYLDQRENRAIIGMFTQDAEVLNCFSYSGGFGLNAQGNGARAVIHLDASADALELLRRNLNLNEFDDSIVEVIQGDVFQILRKFRDEDRRFDCVILDPPKFADSVRNLKQASRGYKDISLSAMKLIRSGGLLATFSCSHHMDMPLFQKITADAALDAGRTAQVIRILSQAADHPVVLHFPESLYLKGLLCRIW